MKILVAEDDSTSGLLLQTILTKAGYEVDRAIDGKAALELLETAQYDALLTDWMMPRMDGIELIHHARKLGRHRMPIIVVTALVSEQAKIHALTSGADGYLPKPVKGAELLALVENCLARQAQALPKPRKTSPAKTPEPRPPFAGIFVAVSTGGPETLYKVLQNLDPTIPAAVFIVLHGPQWMLETFADRLGRETPMPVRLGADGMRIVEGEVFLAPGDVHMEVNPFGPKIRLVAGPPENYVRPAADPLFRSGAKAFGRYSVGVIMTGMGRDGTDGAAELRAAGGTVLVQDPSTSTATSMPESAIAMGTASEVVLLDDLSTSISNNARAAVRKLRSLNP